MNIYICTTGTSVATKSGINIERFKSVSLSESTNLQRECEYAKRQILRRLSDLEIHADYNDFSAEIKSLIKLRVSSSDWVVLLCSDTLDGKLCADVVKTILEERIECKVELKVINGLQAIDGVRFKRKGLKEFLNTITKYLNRYYNVILNPTGGYKSLIPYMSLVGMLYNRPVCYIHEDSEELITLSNLPLTWDDSIFLRIEDKLRKIEQEGTITKEEWLKGIDYDDKRLEGLIEEEQGLITLNGIGLVFYEKFRQNYPPALERDNTPPENKKLNLGKIEHHGKQRLETLAKKILKSPFVKSVINSCDFQPYSKQFITPLRPEETFRHIQREAYNICIVTDLKSDKGISFLIETTARNEDENKQIADLMIRKFFQ